MTQGRPKRRRCGLSPPAAKVVVRTFVVSSLGVRQIFTGKAPLDRFREAFACANECELSGGRRELAVVFDRSDTIAAGAILSGNAALESWIALVQQHMRELATKPPVDPWTFDPTAPGAPMHPTMARSFEEHQRAIAGAAARALNEAGYVLEELEELLR